MTQRKNGGDLPHQLRRLPSRNLDARLSALARGGSPEEVRRVATELGYAAARLRWWSITLRRGNRARERS